MWLKNALVAALTLTITVMMASCGGAVGQGSTGASTSSPSSSGSSVAPSIAAVTPTAALVSSAVALQVSGSGFDANSVILWNETSAATTFVDSSTVATQLSASALTQPGDVDVFVQDAKSLQQSNHIKFHVFSPLSITTASLPSATFGTAYSTTLAATGGQSPYKWNLASGTLPPGMTLSTSGVLAGTPSQSGTFSFTTSATDSETTPVTTNKALSLVVQAAALPSLSITTTTLANATSGSAYSTTLSASGGQSPYKWSLASGALPAGMTLSTLGVLAGTPSQNGTFNFTVSATDSETTPVVATQSLTLPVQAPLSITTASLPSGQVNTAYNTTVAASGGVAPYSWSIYSGALPTGVSLASSTGVIFGTPSASGPFNVTFTVQDAQGTSTRDSFSITIAAVLALQITTASLPNGNEGTPYDATVSVSGGTPPYTWSLIAGSLPSTVALAATTGSISGTPTASGAFTPTIQVTDSANSVISKALPFTIANNSVPVMQSGSGAPLNSVGNNGDLYHRTDVPAIYGPKSGGAWPATSSYIVGVGCTTAFHIDHDCDGYGVGPTSTYDPNPVLGPDADDNDVTVQTAAQAIAKYAGGTAASGGLSVFLSTVKGYTPAHYYWVATTGNNSTGVVDDPTHPFATIAGVRAAHALTSDDMVIAHGGTYTDNWSLSYPATSGTSGHPVIFMAYPGEKPIWDLVGDFSLDPDHGNNYLTFDGINFTNSATGLGRTWFGGSDLGSGSTNVIITNSDTWNRANGVFAMEGLTNWSITNNVFHDEPNGTHCIYLGSRQYPNSNLLVQGNLGYRCPWDGIHHNGRVTNLNITGNVWFQGTSSGVDFQNGPSSSFITNNLIVGYQGAGIKFGNYLDQGCTSPTTFNAPGCPAPIQNNVIENNTIISLSYLGSGVPMGSGYESIWYYTEVPDGYQQYGPIQNNVARNNLMISNLGAWGAIVLDTSQSWNGCQAPGGGAGQGCSPGNNPATLLSGNTFDHNLMTVTGGNYYLEVTNQMAPCTYPGGCTPNTALFTTNYLSGALPASFTNNIYGSSPLFVNFTDDATYAQNPGSWSLKLQPGSPAVGAGIATGAPVTDIQGTTRPIRPSIGAYE